MQWSKLQMFLGSALKITRHKHGNCTSVKMILGHLILCNLFAYVIIFGYLKNKANSSFSSSLRSLQINRTFFPSEIVKTLKALKNEVFQASLNYPPPDERKKLENIQCWKLDQEVEMLPKTQELTIGVLQCRNHGNSLIRIFAEKQRRPTTGSFFLKLS